MKKLAVTGASIFAGLAMSIATIPVVNAKTVVKQIDNETLQVVNYRGKPPFQRRIINLNDDNAVEFARFEERVETSPKTHTSTVRKTGPKGKGAAYARRNVSSQSREAVEFSRFEETDSQAVKSHRMWRGAPGKSRRLLTD